MKTPTAHFALAADCVLFGFVDRRVHIAAGRRAATDETGAPSLFAARLSLPGALIDPRETIVECLRRRLPLEVSTPISEIRPTGVVYDRVDRDPRGRVVSIAYFAFTHGTPHIEWGPAYDGGKWYPIDSLKNASDWAFDHFQIVQDAITHLRHLAATGPGMLPLLADAFTIREAHQLHVSVLGKAAGRYYAFRKKLVGSGYVAVSAEGATSAAPSAGRPAALFRIAKRNEPFPKLILGKTRRTHRKNR